MNEEDLKVVQDKILALDIARTIRETAKHTAAFPDTKLLDTTKKSDNIATFTLRVFCEDENLHYEIIAKEEND